MKRFNDDITNYIVTACRDLTLTTNTGKFLADKSYGFDTMFFVARFIERFRFGNVFRKADSRSRSNDYIKDLFCLREAGQVPNYFNETCALLVFCHILEKRNNEEYIIQNGELLDFIGSSFENAYIFQYLLCYCVFKHDGIWEKYIEFCRTSNQTEQKLILQEIRDIFIAKDTRIVNPNTHWPYFVSKYPMVVLNYANGQHMVSRTGNVQPKIVARTDIALNTEGTRANTDLPKKNDYLNSLSDSYIRESLRPYLAVDLPKFDEIVPPDTFSIDVADTKLDMFDARDNIVRPRKSRTNRYKYGAGSKSRTVQGEFKSMLFKHTPSKCPVCGFDFKELLVASHIKPYAKCEDTYDAMNHNNGLLMCPVCDKLFESANYITIDHRTGKVIYDPHIETEKYLRYLQDKTVDINYIDCERKHYLKWHNDFYKEKHP